MSITPAADLRTIATEARKTEQNNTLTRINQQLQAIAATGETTLYLTIPTRCFTTVKTELTRAGYNTQFESTAHDPKQLHLTISFT